MTSNELRKLSRADLLEMMLAVTKENEQLRKSMDHMKQQLADRTVSVESCGSLAEAVLKINGVMEATQAACDQYVQNIQERFANQKQICSRMEEETKQHCEQMLVQAQAQAQQMLAQAGELVAQAERHAGELVAKAERQAGELIAQAKHQADAYMSDAENKIQKQNQEFDWLAELLGSTEV